MPIEVRAPFGEVKPAAAAPDFPLVRAGALRECCGILKELAKIFTYFAGVILLGALLAPLLYWGGNALAAAEKAPFTITIQENIAEQIREHTGLTVRPARGVLTFLGETDFQKFFNRAVLVAAIALLWPTAKWLRIGGWRDLGIDPDARWRQRLISGFLLAATIVAFMAAAYVAAEVYRWKSPARGESLPWGRLPMLFVSAMVIGLLEEALFRGAIFGLFRRSLKPYVALFWVTAIFSAVHFLKPDDRLVITEVNWRSGFAVLPHVFHQFAEPTLLLSAFTTIFVLGWVCGYATLKTRSLWMAIGFHAGVVFVKMGFSKFTKRKAEHLPWIGEELQIGIVPVLVLAFGGLLVWLWLKYVDRPNAAPREQFAAER